MKEIKQKKEKLIEDLREIFFKKKRNKNLKRKKKPNKKKKIPYINELLQQ